MAQWHNPCFADYIKFGPGEGGLTGVCANKLNYSDAKSRRG